MENNAEKLRIRYPEGFKQEKALERNVENELKHYSEEDNQNPYFEQQ